MAATTATATAPGRLDLMGGVADYSGSLVLEVATAVATTATVSVHAASTDLPADSVAMESEGFGSCTLPLAPLRDTAAIALPAVRAFLQEAGAPAFAFYVFGSLAVFAAETRWLPAPGSSLRVRISSTVPASQGVSSSASIECATLKALVLLTGAPVSALRTAHLAQSAENYVVGAPCGLMDQLSSMLGSPGKVLPILCRPDACAPAVPLPDSVVLVGWPSGVKHSVAASPYLVARTATFMGKKVAERLLGAPLAHAAQLAPSVLHRDVLPRVPATLTGAEFVAQYGGVDDALSRIDPGTAYPVAAALAFPVEENWRCSVALSLLTALQTVNPGDALYATALAQVGELMMQTHAGYSTIGLGAPETDVIVKALMAHGPAGVYGARVSGGGSGGTVVVLCERAALPLVEGLARATTFGEPFTALIR